VKFIKLKYLSIIIFIVVFFLGFNSLNNLRGTNKKGFEGLNVETNEWVYFPITHGASGYGIHKTQDPQAEYDEISNKTFIVFSGEGENPYATYYDHATGKIAAPIKIGTSPLVEDLHGTPTMIIDKDGYIHVFFGSSSSYVHYSKSTNPRNITEWSTTILTDVPKGTYHNPTYDKLTGDIYVVFRAGDSHGDKYPSHEYAGLIRSKDNGKTWDDLGAIIDLTGHPASHSDVYIRSIDAVNGKLYLTWNIAYGKKHNDIRANVYHAYYSIEDEMLYSVNGLQVGKVIDWTEHSSSEICVSEVNGANFAGHSFDNKGKSYVYWTQKIDNEDSIGYMVGYWENGKWKITDIGARTHHIMHNMALRIDNSGKMEAFLISGIEHDMVYEYSFNNMLQRGGNLSVWESLDGIKWSQAELIIGVSETTGQGIDVVTIPKNSHNDLKALAMSFSASFTQFNLPIYGISNENNHYSYSKFEPKSLKHYIRRGLIPSLTEDDLDKIPIGQDNYREWDLKGYLPNNTTEVYLRIIIRTINEDGTFRIVLKEGETNSKLRRDNAVSGIASDGVQEFFLWVPVSSNRTIDWMTIGEVINSITFEVVGYQTH